MDQKTDRLCPTAPFEKFDLEQRLEKKINDVNSFNNHINKNKELVTYFKDKNNKSKRKYKKYRTLTVILKSFDTIVIIATKSTSITLSVTGIGLIAKPISTATACGLSITNKVLYEIVRQKDNKYKKLYEKDQQTIKYFDNLYRKSLQDSIIVINECESLCNIFTRYVDKKMNFFINMNIKKN